MKKTVCYCGSQKSVKDCCYPFLSGKWLPETAEQLMRSRFAAFCTKDIEYLISTLHPSKRQFNDWQKLQDTAQKTQWLALKVLNTIKGQKGDKIGYVEFAAFYKTDETGQLHEMSTFSHENDQWYYVDGVLLDPVTYGRNDPCWCSSHKKYKKCHGK